MEGADLREGTGRLLSAALPLRGRGSPHEVQNKHDQGDKKQKVDQSTGDMCDQTNGPKGDKKNSDGE